MRDLLISLLNLGAPKGQRPAPEAPSPRREAELMMPTLDDPNVSVEARKAMLINRGLKTDAANFVTLAMPMETFATLAELLYYKDKPPSMTSIIEFTQPGAEGGARAGQPVHYRYVASYDRGELTVAHQVQNMWSRSPHPDDPSHSYSKPLYSELSRLTGTVQGDFAFVAVRVLTHPYGAVDVGAATPEQIAWYHGLRRTAEANVCEPVNTTPPALPTFEQRIADHLRAAQIHAELNERFRASDEEASRKKSGTNPAP